MRILSVMTFVTWVALSVGCERAKVAAPATQPAESPRTSSAQIAPANPATSPGQRAPSIILVDQKPIQFPPAVLRVRSRDSQLTAILMSDDPKSAIDDNYHGNSFYLEMPLELTDENELTNYIYRYSAPTSDRADSPNGIFLDGNRIQLQPADLQVKFDGEAPTFTVMLSGPFLKVQTRDDTLAPQRVQVMAKLEAVVRKK